jgi:SAM-dependent methyltransferase
MTNLKQARAGQVAASAAEIYDRQFVPALFGQFAPILAEAVAIAPGEVVLDVGCGTGIAALAALDRAGPSGQVTGIDINPGMLAVARPKSIAITWVEGPAEALPFADDTFDAVLCQFALMFLVDRTAALREMVRVARPGGRIALLTWEAVERTPGYDRLIPLLGDVVGPDTAAALSAPFALGDATALAAELGASGLTITHQSVVTGTARHPSINGSIETEIGGWTLSDSVTADQMAEVKVAARSEFQRFVSEDGSVAFPAPAQMVIARA